MRDVILNKPQDDEAALVSKAEYAFDTELASLADIWQFQLDANMTVISVKAPHILEASVCMIATNAVGKDFFTAINAQCDARACSIFKRLFNAHARIRNVTFVRQGEPIIDATFLVNGYAIWGDDGSFLGYRCAVANVSEAINATRDTTYYEAILTAFVRNVPNLIVVKDVEGRYLTLNPLAERNYGLSHSLLVGRRAEDLLPTDVAAECCRDDDAVLSTESVVSCEQSYQWPDGEHVFHTVKFPIFDADRCLVGSGAIGIDITQQRKIDQGLHRRANYDLVTGLPNRQLMMDRLSQTLALARRTQSLVGIAKLDVGNFKSFNTIVGRAAGDRLLKDVADRLAEVCRETDTIARMEGDVFCLIAPNLKNGEELQKIAEKAMAALAGLAENNGEMVQPSMGTVLFPFDATEPEKLLECATVALDKAKSAGRGDICRYKIEFAGTATRHALIEAQMCGALAANEFSLAYQPIVDAKTGVITGAEALLRWTNAELGVVRPDEFIPIAEHNGLIRTIGAWVFKQACADAVLINANSPQRITVSINVSARQLADTKFMRTVIDALCETEVDATLLKVELTETAFASEAALFKKTIDDLQGLGIGVSLDDFGTGYSSLSYLQQYRFTQLKIDRSFVSDLAQKKDGYLLVEGIVRMAHNLRLIVVAEGVETPEQMQVLSELGCDLIQGYLISKPVALENFQALAAAQKSI